MAAGLARLPKGLERWNPHANIRQDLFGIGDVLGVHPEGREFLLVQTTTRKHISERINKATGCAALVVWLKAGGRFEVWGWAQKDRHWNAKRVEIGLEDLETETETAA
jgi:hypothetical protein